MYHSETALQPYLDPECYHSPDVLERERSMVFGTTWQLVGSASSLRKPGDQIAMDVAGTPVVVRNFDGELVALLNVCAHRQCTLVTKPTGNSEKLKCPYHGWEYGADGRTRKLPAPKNFPDFDRDVHRLARFPLQQCGDLVFVRLCEDGPDLRDWFGDLFERCEEWFQAPKYRPTMHRRLKYPANWKIPVEASLESYHIPEVHPHTFAEDPGESKSDHAFATNSSSFFTSFNTPRLIDRLMKVLEKSVLWTLGVEFTGRYQHHHFFPNLLISHTDSLSLAHTVLPAGPGTSIGYAWQYGRNAERSNPISAITDWWWGWFAAQLALQVLNEDVRIYPHVQRGTTGADRRGVLGRCEERLHVFQKFVHDQMQRSVETTGPCSKTTGSGSVRSASEGCRSADTTVQSTR